MSHNNTSRNAEELSARIKAGEEITFDELERANLTQEERAELLRESLLADIARKPAPSRDREYDGDWIRSFPCGAWPRLLHSWQMRLTQ